MEFQVQNHYLDLQQSLIYKQKELYEKIFNIYKSLDTSQSIMFELLGNYKVPEFKLTNKLVKKYQND